MTVSLYCDGSSTGKSNLPGGWAFVVYVNGEPVWADYGGSPQTTNNEMELTAAVKALEAWSRLRDEFEMEGSIELVSDSKYVLGMASGAHKAVKNVELVERLVALVSKYVTRLRWVPGHSKDKTVDAEMNSRADSLAKRGKAEATSSAAAVDSVPSVDPGV